MTPVTICFVIPQNQNKKINKKPFQQKCCDDLNVGHSMLPKQAKFNFNFVRMGNIAYL